MPPKTTVWDLDPHTRGKHSVLQNYMQAWLPIMSRWNSRVVFIDAFAGPGEYTGGESGSPIIALRALIDHNSRSNFRSEFFYLFIEKDERRYNHLSDLLEKMNDDIPGNCKYRIVNSSFEETLTTVLDMLEEQESQVVPSLVMIDPFGVSDTPMRTVRRLLSNSKSEVYISFMYESINRFTTTAGFESHLYELFGCLDWREAQSIGDPEKRKQFYFKLYERQLKKAGAKYVLRFDLYEGNRLVYAIFFGTQSLDGCDKMKQAIWKEDPLGVFRFRGDRIGQLTLGDTIVDLIPLRQALLDEFGTGDWVSIEKITDFVRSDRTSFHSGHLKQQTLTPMEQEGCIEVDLDSRPRRRGYPEGTRLRFRRVQLSGSICGQ